MQSTKAEIVQSSKYPRGTKSIGLIGRSVGSWSPLNKKNSNRHHFRDLYGEKAGLTQLTLKGKYAIKDFSILYAPGISNKVFTKQKEEQDVLSFFQRS